MHATTTTPTNALVDRLMSRWYSHGHQESVLIQTSSTVRQIIDRRDGRRYPAERPSPAGENEFAIGSFRSSFRADAIEKHFRNGGSASLHA
jgi:hypothetical protein